MERLLIYETDNWEKWICRSEIDLPSDFNYYITVQASSEEVIQALENTNPDAYLSQYRKCD